MSVRNVYRAAKYGRLVYNSLSKTYVLPQNCLANRYKLDLNRIVPGCRRYSTQQTETATSSDEAHHSIIKDSETVKGDSKTHEFMAETKMLLDIVARSLYSDKEVFIRELISNASDALEKLRCSSLNDGVSLSTPLEIHISTDKQNRILTIQDTGIGMTKEELISNLGTIARSGSKAFLEELKSKGPAAAGEASSIIGQFGVGFYSSFMVADKVEVYTRSNEDGSQGYRWVSDGTGTYDVQEAEGVQQGTKILIYLKVDCREYADEDTVKGVINKYSNFVGSPIYMNGKQVNTVQALWLLNPKDVTAEQHDSFYRFVGSTYDRPRFTLHYTTDSPLMIRALLYFPEGKPGLFEISRDSDIGVALYTRKVLIKSKAENILPKWLRFVKGVVDSEDIPLNLSRELLQNSALISKLRSVLTAKILKFLLEQSRKQTEEFDKFYKDYGLFFKEGIVTSHDVYEKEEIAKLLRFESSTQPAGTKVTLGDYVGRLKDGQRDMYYLAAPSRSLAESSPYLEALRKKDVEVLFCYEPYDELVLLQLRQFRNFNLTSVEKEMRDGKETEAADNELLLGDMDKLKSWLKTTLEGKVFSVKTTTRLDSHPCVVTVEEMAAARQFIRQQAHNLPEASRFTLLQPQLEINPKHPIIQKLVKLSASNPTLAKLVAKQLFSHAMLSAGLVDDPRTIFTSINELLTLALEKH